MILLCRLLAKGANERWLYKELRFKLGVERISVASGHQYCISVSRAHLDSCLCETNLACELLPREYVRIVSLGEDCLQLLQLLQWECCPVPSLFSSQKRLVVHIRGVTQSWIWEIKLSNYQQFDSLNLILHWKILILFIWKIDSKGLYVLLCQLTRLVRAEWKLKRREPDWSSSRNQERVGIVEHLSPLQLSAVISLKIYIYLLTSRNWIQLTSNRISSKPWWLHSCKSKDFIFVCCSKICQDLSWRMKMCWRLSLRTITY